MDRDRNKDKALNMSLRYLGYKMRTEKEIKNYLHRKEFSDEDITYVINKLIDYNYINDIEYTELWIRDKYNFSNHGRYRIKTDLLKKGLSKEIIEEKIDNFFNEAKEKEKIKQLYFKKNPDNHKLEPKQLNTICNYILRRGFPGGLVRKTVYNLQNKSDIDQS